MNTDEVVYQITQFEANTVVNAGSFEAMIEGGNVPPQVEDMARPINKIAEGGVAFQPFMPVTSMGMPLGYGSNLTWGRGGQLLNINQGGFAMTTSNFSSTRELALRKSGTKGAQVATEVNSKGKSKMITPRHKSSTQGHWNKRALIIQPEGQIGNKRPCNSVVEGETTVNDLEDLMAMVRPIQPRQGK
ncbi:hypothetical protein ACS0TY_030196 [Phlomoides rotata]